MLWDYENQFSAGQALSATAVSENVVKIPGGDIGKGRPLVLQVMGGGFTGSGTITVEVQTAGSADMSGSKTIATYLIDNAAVLKGGSMKVAAIPTGAKSYLRLNYVVNGVTGGTITAGLVLEGQTAI